MLIRDVIVTGRGRCNLRVRDGRIAGFPAGPRLDKACDEPVIDGRGGRLLPGLHDPHLHLLAAAATARSIDARGWSRDDLSARIDSLAGDGPLRVTGYAGDDAALLDAAALDAICRDTPLRLQYRTGSLWVLNSAALEQLLARRPMPPAEFERGADGRLTGRVWRGDHLLRNGAPDAEAVAHFGRELARHGITAITDASASTDARQAAVIAAAARRLPQKLTLMSGDDLPADPRYRIGPVKILLDDAALPSLDGLVARLARARELGRNVAIHCVTHAELALAVAALQIVGACPDDRIEHGALIAADMIPVLAELGLTVVVQPAFVHAHGDRYRRTVPDAEIGDLLRLGSLLAGGIDVAFSSDAPYGPADPWLAVRAATTRRTRDGELLNPGEAIDRPSALRIMQRHAVIEVGGPADLCLLAPPGAGREDDPVEWTMIDGREVYVRALLGRCSTMAAGRKAIHSTSMEASA